LAALVLLTAGCAETGQVEASTSCDLIVDIEYPGGALHGQPCTSAEDCLYGRCHLSPSVGGLKFCTKPCDCGPGSSCQDEDGAGRSYICQRFSEVESELETMSAFCTQACDAVADCPDGYDDCAVITGSRRVCVARAVEGNR